MLDNIGNPSIVGNFRKFVVGYTGIFVPELKESGNYLFKLYCINDDMVGIHASGTKGVLTKEYTMGYVMQDPNIQDIVLFYNSKGIDIDDFNVHMYNSDIHYICINGIVVYNSLINGYYLFNRELNKLVASFDKSDYLSLPEDLKKEVKSNFLFSRATSYWVSRAKFPNLFRAEVAVANLGLQKCEDTGELLSFEEQMNRKAKRAEARANRYDAKAEKATARGKELQKPINDMHGDISFFTQPNINSSSGRAFSRRRQRMFDAYDRGFEEFKKSEYYADRAEAARATASGTKPTNKAFIDRRLREVDKSIRAQKKNLETYKGYLERIDSGEILKRYNGEVITRDTVLGWIEKSELIIEQEISKSVYYHECLDELGGVQYSQDNIKKGYVVEIPRYGKCKVVSTGPKNIKYVIMEGGAKGYSGTASYAEIEIVLSKETDNLEQVKHPFEVGDVFTIKEWNGNEYAETQYKVVKTTDERVTLEGSNGQKVVRKPRRSYANNKLETWMIAIGNSYSSLIRKIRYSWCEDLPFEDWYSKYESDQYTVSRLYGECHKWVLENYTQGDKCVVIFEYEPDMGKVCLVHSCLLRNGYYLDVRGGTKNFEDVSDGFDYDDYSVKICDTLNEFKDVLKEIGIPV